MSPLHQAEPAAMAGADWETVPRKHVGRWVAAVVVVLVVAWFAQSFANAQIEWSVVREYLAAPVLLKGLVLTLVLTVVAMVLGIVLGVVVAVMRLSKNPITSGVAWVYVWIFRGTPVYLQLLMWFNLALIFPVVSIPGIYTGRTVELVTPFVAAALGLGINQGAYTSEVVRAGILSVDEGQLEAARAIGMTRLKALRRIVLPQAMRVIIPPVGNETISMLKTTSLASAVGVTEIVLEAQHIYFVNNRIMELLIVCAIWYLAAVSVLSALQFYLERHYARGATSRALPPTPLQKLRAAVLRQKAGA
ncbi:amino acid ABC transporter membrane protein, PAAT family [Saccharopolyspora shandongensis]|uniref:Amino acid ABC transporter membrane protein, PAAT family n=1 Tax=Saccharopolyspora shandongensis TaxID=418495 RepID=A0A1H3R816_9PSEU|nr:amino acid ABC transporter permease [Saccharopolyspora shandongensis]SDZ21653.1 amino acid ABC transporter membrane protein, PAAT family [Saccharopolyspora shandongensis]